MKKFFSSSSSATDKPGRIVYTTIRSLLLAILALTTSSAMAGVAGAPEHVNARVVTVSAFPHSMSGVVITWVALTVAPDGGDERREFLMPFLSEDQPQPKVGEDCVFTVHRAKAGGTVGRAVAPTHDAIVIDTFECGPPGMGPSPGTHSAADLNQNRAAFDGKEVTVRGYLWIGGEQMYLVDRRFDADDAWAPDSGCLSLLNFGDLDEHADSFSGKYVELKGKFVKDNKPYGPSLMVCGATGIDLHANTATAIRLRE
ncbi:hypothetical protein KPL74_04580 [Bacillus sp. NP157]|nr:hypothetical protein KPL74_04580 [Bacillus sp. NP157]